MCHVSLQKAPEWLAAIGTVGAVIVALWQSLKGRAESASRSYFERAERALQRAVEDFASKRTTEGRPLNDRRHWLNFARGIGAAQRLASKITTPELRQIWLDTEQYWRQHVYDLLEPFQDSFPGDYYGYVHEEDKYKNIGTMAGERMSLSESSLVVVYRWVQWPKDYEDTLDREQKFSSDEIEHMATFGPRGLAMYIRILRSLVKAKQSDEGSS